MKNKIHVLKIDSQRSQSYLIFVMIWLLLFGVMFVSVSMVAAHSTIVRSEPQNEEVLDESPNQVTVWFSQEIDSEFSTLRVFDSQNNQVDNGDGGVDLDDLDHLSMIATLPPLPSGTYTVQWAVLSAEDGDPTQGEFNFFVSGGAISNEMNIVTGSKPPAWFFSGLIALLLFLVLMWFLFIRGKPTG